LDEPTSDLDPRGRRELKALLQRIPVTKVIATHDLELVAEICSRVLVLDRGRIVAQGPSHEVLNQEALMLEHGLERPHVLRHLHPHA
jgi:cobalt/nickel transport system ATP-binding protein